MVQAQAIPSSSHRALHAGPEYHAVPAFRQAYLDGEALHDLGEVTADVFRGDEGEHGAGGRAYFIHLSVKHPAVIAVQREPHFLSRPDAAYFRLLHPDIEPDVMAVHDGEEFLPGADHFSAIHQLAGNDSVHRGLDHAFLAQHFQFILLRPGRLQLGLGRPFFLFAVAFQAQGQIFPFRLFHGLSRQIGGPDGIAVRGADTRLVAH